jgi:hypothetical protein
MSYLDVRGLTASNIPDMGTFSNQVLLCVVGRMCGGCRLLEAPARTYVVVGSSSVTHLVDFANIFLPDVYTGMVGGVLPSPLPPLGARRAGTRSYLTRRRRVPGEGISHRPLLVIAPGAVCFSVWRQSKTVRGKEPSIHGGDQTKLSGRQFLQCTGACVWWGRKLGHTFCKYGEGMVAKWLPIASVPGGWFVWCRMLEAAQFSVSTGGESRDGKFPCLLFIPNHITLGDNTRRSTFGRSNTLGPGFTTVRTSSGNG